jgi:omega-6 fatty acid desaturase (delta-12 desaturase)
MKMRTLVAAEDAPMTVEPRPTAAAETVESARPSVRHLKQAIRDDDAARSTAIGVALVAIDVSFYAVSLAGAVFLSGLPARVACAAAEGLAIAMLFILGHDACHGSLTASSTLNAALGRLCFLASLFPFSSWEHGHNHLHHGWTNLRDKDYAWQPLSLSEYDALPCWRRTLERIHRSTCGVAFYSMVEIWWLRMIRLAPSDRALLERTPHRFDRLLVGLFAFTMIGMLSLAGMPAVLLGFVVPLFVFHWLFGLVTLVQHTHPRSRWFATRAEWSFYEGQVANTVHVVFPKIVNLILHNSLVHGAHHVDAKLPLYRLSGAQARLERAFRGDTIVERWSLASHRRLFRTCKLYDYERHCWLDFTGHPTTVPASSPDPAIR